VSALFVRCDDQNSARIDIVRSSPLTLSWRASRSADWELGENLMHKVECRLGIEMARDEPEQPRPLRAVLTPRHWCGGATKTKSISARCNRALSISHSPLDAERGGAMLRHGVV
jgi:hypothetical protein